MSAHSFWPSGRCHCGECFSCRERRAEAKEKRAAGFARRFNSAWRTLAVSAAQVETTTTEWRLHHD